MSNVLVAIQQGLWAEHFAIALEIALHERKKGSNVHILLCDTSLDACAANPKHELLKCGACWYQTKLVLKNLELHDQVVLDLKSSPALERPFGELSFEDESELYGFAYEDAPLGAFALSQIYDERVGANIDIPQERRRISLLINQGARLYRRSKEVMQQLKIDEVFVWNGRRPSDGPIGSAAKSLGLKVHYFISGFSPEKFLLLDGPVNQLWSWQNDMSKDVDVSLQERTSTVFEELRAGGGRAIDFVWFASRFSSELESVGEKPRLTIFTSTPSEYLTSKERQALPLEFKDMELFLSKVITETSLSKLFEIVVRWHPNLVNSHPMEMAKVREVINRFKELTHVSPESTHDSYRLMESSQVVLTFGSTLGVESNWYGIPSVLVGDATWSSLPGVIRVENFADLEGEVLNASQLQRVDKSLSIAWANWRINAGIEFAQITWDANRGSYLFDNTELFPLTKKWRKINEVTRKLK